MDVHTELSRLEALGPSVEAPAVSPSAPRTMPEALARWLASVGARPGFTQGPAPSALVRIFTAYAEAQGWPGETDARAVGMAFVRLGCVRGSQPLWGYGLNRDAAAALWKAVGGKPRLTRRPPPRVELPPRKRRKAVRPAKAVRPILTCDGRLWSQRGLAEALGVSTLAVSRVVHAGTALRGLHMRFATPAEVRLWRAQHADDWDGGVPSPS